ncbi:MAG: hypothetical protein JNM40_22095 [Myxococcales bacterium]|nr:hypothetical protein [Myxococcales bacterium]
MTSRLSRSLVASGPVAAFLAALATFLGSDAARAQTGPQEKPRRVALSYFGESAVRPGARLSYEGTAWTRGVSQFVFGASIGGYSASPGYSLFIFLSGGYRLALPTGLFFDLQIGIGYNALNRPGAAQNAADGTIVQTAPTVGNYFMPLGLGGLGFDFQPRLKVPVSLFARAGGYGLTGQGEPFTGSYLLDVGVAYQFGTSKPATVVSPVPSPPPAEAPANLDGPGDPNRVPLIIPPEPTLQAPGSSVSPPALPPAPSSDSAAPSSSQGGTAPSTFAPAPLPPGPVQPAS